jgi:hypothetical protein
MLYRDVEFAAVRLLSPACWKWTIVLGHAEKRQGASSRTSDPAGQKFIDRLIESYQEAAESAEIKKRLLHHRCGAETPEEFCGNLETL